MYIYTIIFIYLYICICMYIYIYTYIYVSVFDDGYMSVCCTGSSWMGSLLGPEFCPSH